MQRKWLVLAAVCLMFFFVTGATFMSMGVVLYSMIADLHWSQTAGGTSFSILGLACCLSSPLPAILMNWIGTRWTMLIGGALLSAGFFCAYITQGLTLFYVGTALMGVGFSLGANIPGVYLLASWFPERSARVIGIYLMFGALGGVAGPPAVEAIVAASGSWRTHWLVMTVLAAVIGLVCLVLVRDRPADKLAGDEAAAAPAKSGSARTITLTARDWVYREAALTPQFMLIAAAMVLTEACVTTVHSAAVTHLSKLGNTAVFAAFMLSLQSAMATLAKGASGTLSEFISPKYLLVGGLVIECVGMILLGYSSSHTMAYGFALTFGIGWGAAYLAVTVLLINYFGPNTGSAVLSTVWLLTGIAAIGPAAAGMVADRFGSYTQVFILGGLLLLPIAFGALLMRSPKRKSATGAQLAAMPANAVERSC
ncbi:MAG: transporter [Nevskia sp.]|nr:transporter [Nevskia sp.]